MLYRPVKKLDLWSGCSFRAVIVYCASYVLYLIYFQVYQQVLSEGRPLIDSLVASITAEKSALENMKSERELMTILNRINGVR